MHNPDYVQSLKDALLWALTQIEDSLDPDHQAALDAAHALLEGFDHASTQAR